MTDTIRTALSAEEWARVESGSYQGHSLAEGQLGVPSGLESINHEAMALANYNLPDHDARKITRADVRLFEDAAYTSRHHGGSEEVADAFDRIAAKLAALLPPE